MLMAAFAGRGVSTALGQRIAAMPDGRIEATALAAILIS